MPTYKLNPDLKIITSPVVLCLPVGTQMQFANGKEAAESTFDTRYLLNTLHAEDCTVVITLKEAKLLDINWTGEEAVSFF